MTVMNSIALGVLCISCGCSESDAIRQYNVTRIDDEEVASDVGDQVWFFKLMGPQAAVNANVDKFVNLLRGTEFSNGQPDFQVPDGWVLSDGPAPRYKTISITGSEPPVEVTVSSLPAPGPGGFSEYLLSNINRWRGQVGLAPLSGQDWATEAESRQELMLSSLGAQAMSVVHLAGETEQYGETILLAAVISKQGISAAATPRVNPPANVSSSEFQYEIPEGWEEAPGNQFSMLAFTVGPPGTEAAKVTVTKLNGGGDVASNVNRWRGQVSLPVLDEAELEAQAEKLEIAGMSGELWAMEGPEQSILGAIAEKDGAKWFYKMAGPTEIVALEKEHFRAFLQSLKLE